MKKRRYVYIVQCGEYVKVGIAGNIHTRIIDLQIGNPLPILFSWLSPPFHEEDARDVERAIHAKMASMRVRGEWFAAPPSRAEKIAKSETLKKLESLP